MTDTTYKTHLDTLAELKDKVGQEIGLTEWVTIEQDRINSFATTTEDNQWIHINPEMSKKYSPYGTPIAHGFLVLSLAPKFSYETLTIGNVVMGVNYGCDKVRFPNATKVGARLRGRIKVVGFEEIKGGARYRMEITFELEGEEKPACVAVMVAQGYIGDKKQAEQNAKLNQMAAVTPTTSAADNGGDEVLYEVKGKVAVITLNRPDRYNGINEKLLKGLYHQFNKARDDKNVRVIVLAGNGKGFCAGADLGDFGNAMDGKATRDFLNSTYKPTLEMMLDTDKPIIAAIHGSAAGAGTGFALACDFRVMEEGASFAFIFSNIGLITDNGSTWMLQRAVGYSKALEYSIEAKKVLASECKAVGLANKLVEKGKALEIALEWAAEISNKAPQAIRSQKALLKKAVNQDLMQSFATEADHQMKLIGSKDNLEGVQAFMEKRKPNFTGA